MGKARYLRSRKWQILRAQTIRQARFRCQRCGGGGPLEVHHKKPIHRGGPVFDPVNLEVLCRSCHIDHHHPLPDELAEWQEHVGQKRRLPGNRWRKANVGTGPPGR